MLSLHLPSMDRVGYLSPLLSTIIYQKHTLQGQLKCLYILSTTNWVLHGLLSVIKVPKFHMKLGFPLFLEKKKEEEEEEFWPLKA